jgi:hypothetical protein
VQKGEHMSYSSSVPSGNQINIVDQVTRAYWIVFERSQLVLEMALLPFVIVLAAELIALLLPQGGFFGLLLAALVHTLGFLIFGSVFVVRWHRYVLLGESVSGDFLPPGWGAFVVAGLKVAGLFLLGWIALVVLAMLPPHALTFPLSMIGSVALGLVVLRLSLVFPAAAIERPVALRTAWDWMAGNYWRLFACAICCYLPFVILEIIISLIGTAFPSLMWIVFEALRLAVSFVGAAVLAAMLSHVYLAIAPSGQFTAE